MQKPLALSVIAVVLIVVLAVLVIIEISRPPAWQVQLDEYIAHCREELGHGVTAVRVERATEPAAFSANASRAVFGDSVYYSYTSWPYPPDKVWCVLAEREYVPGYKPREQILFVALHQDLHNADWVVHEGETKPYSASFLETLSQMGCDLGTAP
jgi:hypothetical protein